MAYRWAVVEAQAPLERISFEPPEPQEGHVLVEVAGCGVCHTDLGFLYGGVRTNHPLPLALGHEISGHVVTAGRGVQGWLGKSVLVPAVLPCGECELCARGRGTICRNQKMPGNDIDGGFASHIEVPAQGLCEVDEVRLGALGLALADVCVVADAVTTPYQAVRRAGVWPGSLAIVVGVGGVGSYAAQIAAAHGATVVAIDVDSDKLAALEQHGVALTINACEGDARAIKTAITAFARERRLPETEWFVFECSGTSAGQLTAFGLLVHGATLSVVGFTMEKIEVRLSNLMAFDARAIGNWGCPPELYPAALDLVLDGKVEVRSFIEPRSLDDINAVLEAAHHHAFKRRPVLVPS
jgi:6-hydroxycyclohex-1-ene-1-carbonyl-CoA dehydrogenase